MSEERSDERGVGMEGGGGVSPLPCAFFLEDILEFTDARPIRGNIKKPNQGYRKQCPNLKNIVIPVYRNTEQVSSFKYLGIEMSQDGTVSSTMNDLCRRGLIL